MNITEAYNKQYEPTKENIEAIVKHLVGLTNRVSFLEKKIKKLKAEK